MGEYKVNLLPLYNRCFSLIPNPGRLNRMCLFDLGFATMAYSRLKLKGIEQRNVLQGRAVAWSGA